MKIGAENKKQLVVLGVVAAVALSYLIYTLVDMNSSPAPAAPAAPVVTTVKAPGTGTAQGHTATQVSNTQLDPTLHMEAMLLAESLEYTGSGRNIFSMNSAPPPPPKIERPIAAARPVQTAPVVPIGPPPPPPIDLRFFGVEVKKDGSKRAFLLKGDEVYIASPGDIVNRRYKINSIMANGIEVTDLQNNNTQRLPLIAQ